MAKTSYHFLLIQLIRFQFHSSYNLHLPKIVKGIMPQQKFYIAQTNNVIQHKWPKYEIMKWV